MQVRRIRTHDRLRTMLKNRFRRIPRPEDKMIEKRKIPYDIEIKATRVVEERVGYKKHEYCGINAFEALTTHDVPSNVDIDEVAQLLSEKSYDFADEKARLSAAFWCWTGTLVAFNLVDIAFEDEVRYKDPLSGLTWIFPVPEEYQGAKNAALVLEPGDYDLSLNSETITIISDASNVSIVENLPSESGWHMPDRKHGIPCGVKVDGSDEKARYISIYRISNRALPDYAPRIAAISRGFTGVGSWRSIGLQVNPDYKLGLVVKNPKEQ